MAGRFDLRPLLHGLNEGLRRRRAYGDEAPDTGARVVLVLIPLLAGGAAAALGPFKDAGQLLAGFALLIGALIATFAQLSSWRDQLTQRGLKIDKVRIRALDEAAAHVLVAVVSTIIGTATLVLLSNSPDPPCSPLWQLVLLIALKTLSALAAILFTYVALTLIIVVNLLWDAYTASDEEP